MVSGLSFRTAQASISLYELRLAIEKTPPRSPDRSRLESLYEEMRLTLLARIAEDLARR